MFDHEHMELSVFSGTTQQNNSVDVQKSAQASSRVFRLLNKSIVKLTGPKSSQCDVILLSEMGMCASGPGVPEDIVDLDAIIKSLAADKITPRRLSFAERLCMEKSIQLEVRFGLKPTMHGSRLLCACRAV